MGFKGPENDLEKDLENALSSDPHSYIVITCSEPNSGEINNKEMNVEFSYKGDRNLISCLLNDAQNYIDAQDDG